MQFFDVRCPCINAKTGKKCNKLVGRINGWAKLYCPKCKVENTYYMTMEVPSEESNSQSALTNEKPES